MAAAMMIDTGIGITSIAILSRGGGGVTINPPVFSLTSAPGTNPPEGEALFDETVLEGDTLEWGWSLDPDFGTDPLVAADGSNEVVLTALHIANDEAPLQPDVLADGEWYHALRVRRGSNISVWSNVETDTISASDTTPDAFSFVDQTGVAVSTLTESNTITVAGLGSGVSTAVSISGGEYQKNGGAWSSAGGTAVNGDTFKVRHTSSASNVTATNTTLTIGGVSDTFTSTTEAAAFTPASEFAGGETGDWFAAELASFFTNDAGTTPCTADGDPLRCWKGKRGVVNLTTNGTPGRHAVIRYDGALGKWYVEDNGSLQCQLQAAFTLNQPCSRMAAFRSDVWTSEARVLGGGTADARIYQNPSSPNILSYAGVYNSALAVSGATDGTDHVLTNKLDGANTTLKIDNGAPTTGNTGSNNPGGLTLFSAWNGDTTGRFNGRFYGLIIKSGTFVDEAGCRTFFGNMAGLSL
jgi:hypothetical protein